MELMHYFDSPGIFLKSVGVYLSCYGHSVKHIPQNNAHNHFVSQVEDDPFAIFVIVLVHSRSRC